MSHWTDSCKCVYVQPLQETVPTGILHGTVALSPDAGPTALHTRAKGSCTAEQVQNPSEMAPRCFGFNPVLSMPIPAILVFAFQVAAGQTFDIQGHRGARGLLPENSTAGFLHAVDLGVSTLEIDVVVAGDSTVVVSHEPWMLDAICSDPDGRAITDGESYNIFRMSYEAVARFDCGMRGHPGFPRQNGQAAVKPRLSDVIHAVESHAAERGLDPLRYNIEIKSREEWDGIYTPPPAVFAQLVHDVVVKTGIMDRTTIQSFDFRTLQAVRGIGASWQLAVLVSSDRDLPAVLNQLGFTPQVFSPNFQIVDKSLVLSAHNLGMRVIPWTVNEVSDMRRLMAMGVDGLITDYPDLAMTLSDQ